MSLNELLLQPHISITFWVLITVAGANFVKASILSLILTSALNRVRTWAELHIHSLSLSLFLFHILSHPACCSFAPNVWANPRTNSQRFWVMSKQEVFPRTNAHRWQETHNFSPSFLSLSLSLYCDWMHIHKQATFSIISCLFMERVIGKNKLAKAEVNTADVDLVLLLHTQTTLLVYPGHGSDNWLNRNKTT